jgi:bifunctional non-homologous end joining protein LigD
MDQLDMEGIVMKERNGLYHIGMKHPTWFKVKCKRKMKAVVGGVTLKGGIVNALLLGAYQEGQLIFIGGAGSGLTNDHLKLLTESVRSLRQETCPFVNPPKLRKGEFAWFVPSLTVLVEYLEWTEEITLRAPVVKKFGQAAPEECRFP